MLKRSKAKLSAILLMSQSSIAFSVMVLSVRLLDGRLPSTEVVFFRSLIGSIIIYSLIRKKKASLFGKLHGLLFLRGLSGFIALSLFFYAMHHLPLGTAVILNYTSPIFAALLAIGFLKERPNPFLIVMMLLAFAGVYLLVGGEFRETNPVVILGLLSAVFASIAYISIRSIRHRESPLTVIFYFTAISTFGSLFYLPFGFRWPNAMDWIYLAGVGIGSFYGQMGMTIALRRAPSSLISPFTYITPLLSFLYGTIFFEETLSLRGGIGAALIILSGILISYYETKIRFATPR